MRSYSWLLMTLFAVSVLLPSSTQAQVSEQVKPLLKYVPGDGNSIAILHIDYLLKTNRAEKENWNDHREKIAIDAIPHWIQSLLVASSFDPFSVREDWLLALTKTKEGQFEQMATEHGTAVQTIADCPTYLSPKDMYVTQLSSGEVGAFSPPSRQEFVRWIRSATQSEQTQLTPYLVEAASQNVHLVMALDLEDIFDPNLVEKWLQSSKSMRDYPHRIPEMANLMQQIQGLNLRVIISDKNRASLSIDFKQPVGKVSDLVKPVFLEILQELQFSLPDLQKSEVEITGKSVLLNMDLFDYSLRHLISMVLSPHHQATRDTVVAQAETPTETRETPPKSVTTVTSDGTYVQQDPELVASQNYLRSVISIMTDLEKLNSKATNYLNTASWHDNASHRIDRLPTRGVNDELLAYGANLSSELRALASSLRGVAIKIDTEKKTFTYSYGVSATNTWGGGWGGRFGRNNAIPMINWNNNIEEIRKNQAKAVQEGAKEREEIWQMIKDEHNAIKLKMREEYGDEFLEGLENS